MQPEIVRHPGGTPAGGRFAPKQQSEGDVTVVVQDDEPYEGRTMSFVNLRFGSGRSGGVVLEQINADLAELGLPARLTAYSAEHLDYEGDPDGGNELDFVLDPDGSDPDQAEAALRLIAERRSLRIKRRNRIPDHLHPDVGGTASHGWAQYSADMENDIPSTPAFLMAGPGTEDLMNRYWAAVDGYISGVHDPDQLLPRVLDAAPAGAHYRNRARAEFTVTERRLGGTTYQFCAHPRIGVVTSPHPRFYDDLALQLARHDPSTAEAEQGISTREGPS